MDKIDDDYQVGYGRPPKQTRFRKGKSGNPTGRPKGSNNLPASFTEVSQELITVTKARCRTDDQREGTAVSNEHRRNPVATTELIHSLPMLSKDRLNALWHENFAEPPGKIRRELMLPILAFRIQERIYGGFTAKTKQYLREILNSLAPKSRFRNEARRRFKPGTRLVREWKGEIHEVILSVDGYEYRSKRYKSLSPIACEITGTRRSGPAFFGTREKEDKI